MVERKPIRELASEVRALHGAFSMSIERMDEILEEASHAAIFEGYITKTISRLYESLPNGKKNYFGENPVIGTVTPSRYNQRNERDTGFGLFYLPSKSVAKDWNDEIKKCHDKERSWERFVPQQFRKELIVSIDFSSGIYEVKWEDDGAFDYRSYILPRRLIDDTNTVLNRLALEESEQSIKSRADHTAHKKRMEDEKKQKEREAAALAKVRAAAK